MLGWCHFAGFWRFAAAVGQPDAELIVRHSPLLLPLFYAAPFCFHPPIRRKQGEHVLYESQAWVNCVQVCRLLRMDWEIAE